MSGDILAHAYVSVLHQFMSNVVMKYAVCRILMCAALRVLKSMYKAAVERVDTRFHQAVGSQCNC